MSGKRRVLGAALKAKVALAAVRGDRTTSQFGVHAGQVISRGGEAPAAVCGVKGKRFNGAAV